MVAEKPAVEFAGSQFGLDRLNVVSHCFFSGSFLTSLFAARP
jgi:hypothetical protein